MWRYILKTVTSPFFFYFHISQPNNPCLFSMKQLEEIGYLCSTSLVQKKTKNAYTHKNTVNIPRGNRNPFDMQK